ncbi:right-handed parallel beta-helix repeat-containing protein [candidate division KSB1 bacterium]|nr:right-handed parallel beta-helix repeat-containing protein [candidate division KSB1 bacterium]
MIHMCARWIAAVFVVFAAFCQAAQLELYPTFHSMGVIVNLEGEDNDADAVCAVEYRTDSEPDYHSAFPPSRVQTDRFVGSLFRLQPGTTYHIRVTFDDPDNGPLSSLVLNGTSITRNEISVPAASNSIYVSPTGDDENGTGSQNSPYAGINRAMQDAGPGDHVVLMDGVYYQGEIYPPDSGLPGSPIVIRSAEGADVVVDGSYSQSFSWTPNGGGVYRTTVPTADPHLVLYQGQRLYPYQNLADLSNLIWDISGFYANGATVYLHLTDHSAPDPAQVRISRFNYALYIEQDYIYILDITFRYFGCGSWAKAIYLNNAGYNLVQGCTFAVNDLGIGIKRASPCNVIQDNEFYDTDFDWPWDAVKDGSELETGGVAMYDPMTGRGTVIRRNSFHDYFDGSSISPGYTAGLTNETDFYENTIYRCGDDGVSADGQASNVRIWDNEFYDILMGISLAPVYTGPVYAFFNLIYSIGVGNNSYSGSPFKFNSGYSLSGPMYLFHNTCDAALPGNNGLYIKAPGTWTLIYARNNIWAGTDYAVENYNASQPVDMDYDNLYTPGTWLARWDGTRYSTMADFQNGTGLEIHGLDGEPGFTAPLSGDYSLASNSPLVDQGVVIPGINDGYNGSAPDIGAFETESGIRTFEYNLNTPGWHLLSLPGTTADMSVAALFPDAAGGCAYQWLEGAYVPVYTVEAGKGYFLAFTQPVIYQIALSVIDTYQLELSGPDWTLIGSVGQNVDFTAPDVYPSGSISLPIYSYNTSTRAYISSNIINTTLAYWLWVEKNCQLNVGTAAASSLGLQKRQHEPPEPPVWTGTGFATQKPAEFALLPNFPNPFNAGTEILFSLAETGPVRLSIYDIRGRLVYILENRVALPGFHQVTWHGTDGNGQPVASGIYWVRMQAGAFTAQSKLILLK